MSLLADVLKKAAEYSTGAAQQVAAAAQAAAGKTKKELQSFIVRTTGEVETTGDFKVTETEKATDKKTSDVTAAISEAEQKSGQSLRTSTAAVGKSVEDVKKELEARMAKTDSETRGWVQVQLSGLEDAFWTALGDVSTRLGGALSGLQKVLNKGLLDLQTSILTTVQSWFPKEFLRDPLGYVNAAINQFLEGWLLMVIDWFVAGIEEAMREEEQVRG